MEDLDDHDMGRRIVSFNGIGPYIAAAAANRVTKPDRMVQSLWHIDRASGLLRELGNFSGESRAKMIHHVEGLSEQLRIAADALDMAISDAWKDQPQ